MTQVLHSKQTHKSMIERAYTEISLLMGEERAIAARLESLAPEISLLDSRSAAREQRLLTAQQTNHDAKQRAQLLTAQAQLSIGTLAQEELQREAPIAEKEAGKTQKALNDLRVKTEKEAQEDGAKLQLMQQEKSTLLNRLTAIQEQRTNYTLAIQVAQEAIGEIEYKDAAYQIELSQKRIEALKGQIEEEQQAHKTLIVESSARLEEWPQLKNAIQPATQREDSVTRVLVAEIAYLESLCVEGRTLPSFLPGVSALNGFYNWLAALSVPVDELYVREHVAGTATMLRARLALVAQALEQYQKRGV